MTMKMLVQSKLKLKRPLALVSEWVSSVEPRRRERGQQPVVEPMRRNLVPSSSSLVESQDQLRSLI